MKIDGRLELHKIFWKNIRPDNMLNRILVLFLCIYFLYAMKAQVEVEDKPPVFETPEEDPSEIVTEAIDKFLVMVETEKDWFPKVLRILNLEINRRRSQNCITEDCLLKLKYISGSYLEKPAKVRTKRNALTMHENLTISSVPEKKEIMEFSKISNETPIENVTSTSKTKDLELNTTEGHNSQPENIDTGFTPDNSTMSNLTSEQPLLVDNLETEPLITTSETLSPLTSPPVKLDKEVSAESIEVTTSSENLANQTTSVDELVEPDTQNAQDNSENANAVPTEGQKEPSDEECQKVFGREKEEHKRGRRCDNATESFCNKGTCMIYQHLSLAICHCMPGTTGARCTDLDLAYITNKMSIYERKNCTSKNISGGFIGAIESVARYTGNVEIPEDDDEPKEEILTPDLDVS